MSTDGGTPGPGGFDGSVLVGRSGTRYRRAVVSVPGRLAQRLVADGAEVAVDSCGCGGFCGTGWLDGPDRTRLVRGEVPRIRKRDRSWSGIQQWVDDAGVPLVLLVGGVRWGRDPRTQVPRGLRDRLD